MYFLTSTSLYLLHPAAFLTLTLALMFKVILRLFFSGIRLQQSWENLEVILYFFENFKRAQTTCVFFSTKVVGPCNVYKATVFEF